jgi:hypothetical protein
LFLVPAKTIMWTLSRGKPLAVRWDRVGGASRKMRGAKTARGEGAGRFIESGTGSYMQREWDSLSTVSLGRDFGEIISTIGGLLAALLQ